MFSKEINIKHSEIPEKWSIEAADLAVKVSQTTILFIILNLLSY